MIGIIDYGSGNFTSVYNAMKLLTNDIITVKNSKDLEKCSHIILPGVGSFGNAMSKLKEMGILNELKKCVFKKKTPFLGICVGMQILAEFGYEFEKHEGLAYLKGDVQKLKIDQNQYPLPHMGWNNIINTKNSPLFKGIEKDATFYFVHSYYLELKDKKIKTVNVDYGKIFTAALSIDNIHAVQFHPEKSQYYGLKLLKNFITL